MTYHQTTVLRPCCVISGFILLLVCTTKTPTVAFAESPDAMQSARRAISGEDAFIESATMICQRAASKTGAARFELLKRHVLPQGEPRLIRIDADFSASQNRFPSGARLSSDIENTNSTGSSAPEVHSGELTAPVLMLCETARELGQLSELRTQISGLPEPTITSRVAKLSALTIADIAAEDHNAATTGLSDLLGALQDQNQIESAWEAPLLLSLTAAVKNHVTRTAGRDLALAIVQKQQNSVAICDCKAFEFHVMSLAERLDAFNAASTVSTEKSARSLRQWKPGTIVTASTLAQEHPNARWNFDGTSLNKVSAHNLDHLYFQSPLTGDFEVQFTASAFSWTNVSFAVGSVWAGMTKSFDAYDLGVSSECQFQSRPLTPPISKVRNELRYRVTVRADTLGYYANGRLFHSETLSGLHDPWIAFRHQVLNSGRIHDVRILGQPEIPDEIHLLRDPSMRSWISFYDQTPTPESAGHTWRHQVTSEGVSVLKCDRRTDVPAGCFCEDLIYYHRPILEDGTIEYEFFHETGRQIAHPAINRHVFLLTSKGLQLYHATHGVLDRAFSEPFASLKDTRWEASAEMPLKENAWNRMRLEFTGNSITAYLNDVRVGQQQKPQVNPVFGLFRFSDQSGAQIRNMIWRGEWPKSLPSVYEQELASQSTLDLEEFAAQLPHEYRYAFTEESVAGEKFLLTGAATSDVKPGREGLSIQHQGRSRYERASLAPQIRVEGDFDIAVSFDQLVTDPAPQANSNLVLFIQAEDSERTEFSFRRRHNRYSDGVDDQNQLFTDSVRYNRAEAQRSTIGLLPCENDAGTLRLIRKGKVLFCLFAEGDSQSYQQMFKADFPSDPLPPGGIQLRLQTFEKSFLSVRWKELVIRSEKMKAEFESSSRPLSFAELNKARDELTEIKTWDFSKTLFPTADFFKSSDVAAPPLNPAALKLSHRGTDRWTAAGLRCLQKIEGDFDITAEMEMTKIVDSNVGEDSSIYLKLNFADQAASQIGVMFQQSGQDRREAFGRIGKARLDGSYDFRPVGAQAFENVTSLRLARYGDRAYFLARQSAESPEVLLESFSVTTAPLMRGGLLLMLHSGGAGRETHGLIHSLQIRTKTQRAD